MLDRIRSAHPAVFGYVFPWAALAGAEPKLTRGAHPTLRVAFPQAQETVEHTQGLLELEVTAEDLSIQGPKWAKGTAGSP